ncbi:MAG: HIT family hydrolase [Candidatus Omnitrophica bacterium CG1_02_40_15]|nr:MAG: HIT family hydrolase [Candidatus Omnitrophica bacterium CG1_02_40_15]
MNRLWAPWRNKFVTIRKIKGCIFCMKNKVSRGRFQTVPYIIRKSRYSFAMLNIYPYNNGHIMVSPFRHVKDLKGLNDAELLDIIKLTRDMQALLEKKLKPHGFNIGINTGKVAGAGYKGHLHIHIVPRWKGDSNFMPVVADTKIMPQSLKELHRILKT